jgi:hypothetical protein
MAMDKDAHGRVSFHIPALDGGTYVMAAWCKQCAPYSAGRSFFVIPAVPGRFHDQMQLTIEDGGDSHLWLVIAPLLALGVGASSIFLARLLPTRLRTSQN